MRVDISKRDYFHSVVSFMCSVSGREPWFWIDSLTLCIMRKFLNQSKPQLPQLRNGEDNGAHRLIMRIK